MSAPQPQNDSFGTSSPPLEATKGGEEPMGVSSISGDKPKGVPDKQQRGGAHCSIILQSPRVLTQPAVRLDYFKDNWKDSDAGGGDGAEQVSAVMGCADAQK
ncbi:hypothetical protein DICSQDRAFT_72998 [Dichomitus squalens LYAD-421 SS1]|uniref:Uncharacterized protein n=1 Tax=Dichomitus squalens (strain LYAD-421) TaxID=732165 RepID=R7SL53_DICSQ|nr:uncharacterized protein DICSQDRAFT_72998 [Dichomitus squalens LYAD-421 SS1]EJF55752.1 hypothetical protein DICSQDRAFT_72998 [Dichomitus squalens LYAD-421 SS1]